jgi:hypothetical protein
MIEKSNTVSTSHLDSSIPLMMGMNDMTYRPMTTSEIYSSSSSPAVRSLLSNTTSAANQNKRNLMIEERPQLLSMKGTAASRKKKRKSSNTLLSNTSVVLLSQRNQDPNMSSALFAMDVVNTNEDDSIPMVAADGSCLCSGCTKPRCGKCTLCEQSGFLYNTCVFRTCHVTRDHDEELQNLTEINSILEDDDTIDVGTRVYAEWEKNCWYWGHVTRQYSMKRNFSTVMCKYYSVTFEDGDKRSNINREVRTS